MNKRRIHDCAVAPRGGSLTAVTSLLRHYSTSPLTAAVLVALYPPLTLAQRASSGGLEEIVVTATRREINLQDVGQSVRAFSTADIERQAFQDAEDVISALPSVNLVNNQPGRNSIIMRGISTGSAEYRTDSQVAVYLDDQPLTSISQQVDIKPIDIERIESLPGPQGTLFGSSSQSGTLVYVTNKPDPSAFGAQLDGEIGSTKGGEESYDVSGHVNLPLSDSFAVRLVGFYSLEGGYVDNVLAPTLMGDTTNANVVEDNWNDAETYGGRIAARWFINPKWETTLSFVTQYAYNDGTWETDGDVGDYKTTRFFDEWRDDDWWQGSLNVKGDLGFAELSVTGSYFDRKIKYEWDNMVYDQYRSATTYYAAYDTGLTFGMVYNDQKQKRYSYEVRLTSQGESRFQWMAGAFYEKVYDWWDTGTKNPSLTSTPAWEAAQYYACAAAYYGYDVACPLPDTDVFYSNKYDKTIKQKALFGELTYSLTDKWSVTGGMRWFEYDRKQFDIYNAPLGLPAFESNPTLGRVESQGKSSDTVLKFATEYKFDADRMVYLLYSEGFRLGGNNDERVAATGLLPREYDPDKMKNYEAGLKSKWWDGKLLVNASLFYMQWDDIQLNDSLSGIPDPTGGNYHYWQRGTFNGKKAEQKGIEITTSVAPTDNLYFEASAFLADPEFSEDTIYPNGDTIEAGTTMPVSPDRKYYAAVQYTIPAIFGSNGNAWVHWAYSWNSEVYNGITALLPSTTPEEKAARLVPAWSTSTLQFGYSHNSGWDATLIIRNLFDESNVNWLSSTWYDDVFDDAGNQITVNADRFDHPRTLQRPRTISLSFTKKW
jgi:outer membrane receptor protein involved in Fe transport